jgi:triosephosphate isomerase
MYKRRAEALAFADGLAATLGEAGEELDAVDVAVCPPLTSLVEVAERLVPLGVGVWAQNGHAAAEGAFTGEISMAMLADAGATGVLLGHSERRQLFGETDEALADKVVAALDAGLEPVLCIGESEAEREAGHTAERLRTQLETGLSRLDAGRAVEVVIAYEPVWAIGTGRAATPELAQETHALIRDVLAARHGAQAAEVRLIYGGSVKPDNAASYDGPDIDGALVGGASLEVASFIAIVRAFVPPGAR